jgi:hypothetical protein
VFEIMAIEQNYQTNVILRDLGLHHSVDGHCAKSIARKFLEQYHSLLISKDAVLEGMIWTVTMDVGHVNEHIMHVKVDAKTGRILGYL